MPAVPDGESEHSPKQAHAFITILLVSMDNCFRVRLCIELVTERDQVRREIAVIVDLAVKDHDYRSVFVEDRLFAAAEVDDTETTVSESDIVLDEITVIIRPTMRLNVGHPLNKTAIYRLSCVEIDDPANPAHRLFPRPPRVV